MTPDEPAWSAELRARISDVMIQLNADELAVIEAVAAGLGRGRAIYGPLHIDTDRRDLLDEAGEEARDELVYLAAHVIRLNRLRARR